MKSETEKIEFKSIVTDKIYREVIAFANTYGGEIYIGVNDLGEKIGVDDIDHNLTRITNGIRDAVMPDVTLFVNYKVIEDNVIVINISEGTNKPYFLKSKGLKPSGVFVRQGNSSVQASFDMIRSMIKITDGDEFEKIRSIEQDLTFKNTSSFFGKYNIEFNQK